MTVTAFSGARIFDGFAWHQDAALIVADGIVRGVVPMADSPAEAERVVLPGGLLVPGFVDLQVNGGGGVQFNDRPDCEAIATICAAHQPFGTTALLATLITDSPDVGRAALLAGAEAKRLKIPGFLGLHMEGPHLDRARKGTHDPQFIRPMDADDLAALAAARAELDVLLATVAPEAVTPEQAAALVAAGIIVSLGHSDCSFAAAMAMFEAGARMVTHLHNAMSPLQNREPGLVGAALAHPGVACGLIADGIHVHPATLAISVAAKRDAVSPFLVTDAMAVTGSTLRAFTLNGRTITRADGALRLADGTLAGADLTMIEAVRYMHRIVGVSLEDALRMASLSPARAVGQDATHGHLRHAARADIVHLSDQLDVTSVWIGGQRVVG